MQPKRDSAFEGILITSKASDARRRGATTRRTRIVRRNGRGKGNVADDVFMVDQGWFMALLPKPDRGIK
jgi:hypothetical protein